jgi:hypothetical protein
MVIDVLLGLILLVLLLDFAVTWGSRGMWK